MGVYAKIHTQTKRQALGKLPSGKGTLAPEGVLEYPGNAKAITGAKWSPIGYQARKGDRQLNVNPW
jgi:hypothetical protein